MRPFGRIFVDGVGEISQQYEISRILFYSEPSSSIGGGPVLTGERAGRKRTPTTKGQAGALTGEMIWASYTEK
jgi:hypothetical protein